MKMGNLAAPFGRFNVHSRTELITTRTRRTSRRNQIESLLARGRTYAQIAKETDLARATVYKHAKALFKTHNVHSRRQLMTKLQLHRATPDTTQPTASPAAPRLRIAG